MNPRQSWGILVASLLCLIGIVADAVAATNDLHSRFGHMLPATSGPALLSLIAVVPVVVVAGAFTLYLRRVSREALARTRDLGERAAAQEERAWEAQELLDTSTMLAATEDLETTLSIALLRLADLIPYDICCLFLYDAGANQLELADRMRMSEESAAAFRTLPLQGLEWSAGDEAETLLWSRDAPASRDLGVLANLDPDARSVIVAPLRPLPLQGFLGLIYVSARGEGGLTERHRRRLDQFARYAAFHIEQKRVQDRFRMQARTDAMTGLDNYRSFRQRLEDETRRARRYNRPLSLILLDIDHFKRINDTYLHVAGDAILRQMAAVLREILRGSDVAARYGGEEMAIICPETGANDARTLAERIRATVEMRRFALPTGSEPHEIEITISLGVATVPTHATSDAILVEQADKALYAAKTAGRNRVCMAAERKPGVALA